MLVAKETMKYLWKAILRRRGKAILNGVINSRIVSHSICEQDLIVNTIRRDCFGLIGLFQGVEKLGNGRTNGTGTRAHIRVATSGKYMAAPAGVSLNSR